jgi:hypothetical protein
MIGEKFWNMLWSALECHNCKGSSFRFRYAICLHSEKDLNHELSRWSLVDLRWHVVH